MVLTLVSHLICLVKLRLHARSRLACCDFLGVIWVNTNLFCCLFVLDLILLYECICIPSNQKFVIWKSFHQNIDPLFKLFKLFLVFFCLRTQMNAYKNYFVAENNSGLWIGLDFLNVFRTNFSRFFYFFKTLSRFSKIGMISDCDNGVVFASFENFKFIFLFETVNQSLSRLL